MFNIDVVRAALASQVGQYAVPALRSLPQAEDQVNPPVGIVMPGNPYINYGVTLQGATDFMGAPSLGQTLSPTVFALDYWILLAKASTLERVEQNLDAWLGVQSDGTAVSVVAAIGVDPSLGGTVAWCVPLTADRPGPVDFNGIQMFGTRIHLSLSSL